jgi:hypothetical protein
MKKILIALGLLGVIGVLWAQNAANYQYREPTASEKRKIAGVTDFIQDGPRFNFTEFIPGAEQQITLNETNNVVMFTSVSQLTNVVVLLPNCTNSARRSYRLIANGNVTMTLSNTVGNSFKTPTNTVAATSFVTATNRAVWVYNNNRTNWFVYPDLP